MNHRKLRKIIIIALPVMIVSYALLVIGWSVTSLQERARWMENAFALSLNRSQEGRMPSVHRIHYRLFVDRADFLDVYAESVSLRNQKLGSISFPMFYELVLSGVQVYVPRADLVQIMDWAKSENLMKFVAPFVSSDHPSMRGQSLKALKVRFEDLHVFLGSETSDSAELVVSAGTMIKESFTEELSLQDGFRFTPHSGTTFSSTEEARWMLLQQCIAFPVGFRVNRQEQGPGTLSLSRLMADDPASDRLPIELDVPADPDADPELPNGPPSVFASKGSPVTGDVNALVAEIKTKDPNAIRSAMWELLALNPGILKQAGVSPTWLMFGGQPKLGAFDVNPMGAQAFDTN